MVKSLYRVPTPITTVGVAGQRVRDRGAGRADAANGHRMIPRHARPCRPECRMTGIPVALGEATERVAGLRVQHSPPATMSGRFAARMTSAARATATGSGSGRPTCHTRRANSSSGQSNASACTSCGIAMVTAPVSAGSVRTRIAASSADGQLFGPVDPIEEPEIGRNASLTDTSNERGPPAPAAPVRSHGSRRCRWAGAAPGCG